MHIEILAEDSSGKKLLEIVIPKIVGEYASLHTWRIISYKGIGRVPTGLTAKGDPAKRVLLDQLPKILRGYMNTPWIDAVVVVLDADSRQPGELLGELNVLAQACKAASKTHFQLAVEETESWYLGDKIALLAAYPRAKKDVLYKYVQDSVCGTWELMAEALYPGGMAQVKKVGWPLPGKIKHEWAEKIGPHMVVDRNLSPSFGAFRDCLRHLLLA